MSVYRRNNLWHYDFWLQGRRFHSPKGYAVKSDAVEAEAHVRRVETRRASGLEALDASETPYFTDWAAVAFRWQRDRKGLKRPDQVQLTYRMILAFWGAKPARDPVDGGEYRNLRLGDPIQRPELIEDFEVWMTRRGLSGARKNHYRSACSMLYRVAMLPTNRRRSGIRENPFMGVLRDRVTRRTGVMTLEQLEQWTTAAPVPVAIAVTIGALAPALRFGNIATLRRSELSPARDFLTVPHKADRETGLPLTIAISPPLRRLIEAIERQWPDDPYVVPLAGERYWQLHKLVRKSIQAVPGLQYGRKASGGITFHSLRHALQTWLARWGVTLAERQRALGHATPQMSAWYEHLGGADTVRPMSLIAERVAIADGVITRIEALAPNGQTAKASSPAESSATRRRQSPRPATDTARRPRVPQEEPVC